MPRRERRKLTDTEIAKLEAWSAVRVPFDHICQLLDIAVTDLRDMVNKNAVVRRALEGGRAKASSMTRRTLYDMAIGRPARRDPKTGDLIDPALEPDFQALKFWCQTQEGFKTADKLEISGPEGAPIETSTVSREERLARIAELNRKLKATDDE